MPRKFHPYKYITTAFQPFTSQVLTHHSSLMKLTCCSLFYVIFEKELPTTRLLPKHFLPLIKRLFPMHIPLSPLAGYGEEGSIPLFFSFRHIPFSK
jgi:hypothetical protein